MKKTRFEKKEQEICGWGVENEIERDVNQPSLTHKFTLLPQISLKHKFPSMDLAKIKIKRKRKGKRSQREQEPRGKIVKTEIYDGNQEHSPVFQPKNNGIRLFPSLPILVAPHSKKNSNTEAAPPKQINQLQEQPTPSLFFAKYEDTSDNLSYKLLQSKNPKLRTSSNHPLDSQNPQFLRRRESKAILKVNTIQIINNQIQKNLIGQRKQPNSQKSINQKRKCESKVITPFEQGQKQRSQETIDQLLSLKQTIRESQQEFNDHDIFSRPLPLIQTEACSPTKGQSKTQRYRLVIKQ